MKNIELELPLMNETSHVKAHVTTAPSLEQLPIAQIERLSHEGRGIARVDGKTIFIQGALAGETVSFRYKRKKKQFDEGEVVSILSASPFRVEPRCPNFSRCGGCSMQHLEGKEQLRQKHLFLLDLLERIGQCAPENVLEPLESDLWHYRNKARLGVKYVAKKGSCLVGFREKDHPAFITDMMECSILNRQLDAQLPALRALIAALDNPRSIPQIEVAVGNEEVACIFRHLEPLSLEDHEKLRDFGKQSKFRIYLQAKGPDSIQLFYPDNVENFLQYSLPDEGITFQFQPTDFFQINAGLNQAMVTRVLELMELKEDDVVLDLFCGLGNFSLPIAKRCAAVIGIEGDERMVRLAATNAKNNDLKNVRFLCQDLYKSLVAPVPKLTHVLLDPPRSGAFEVVKQMDHLSPKRVVYVSCNPATLARDAEILVHEKGYQLRAAGVLDMFPQTAHVESVAVFDRMINDNG